MDTRDRERLAGAEEPYEKRGLGPWVRRNPWLLVRLFMVLVLTFPLLFITDDLSYGLQGKPEELAAAELDAGRIPPGVEVGDYVQVRGTPDVGEDLRTVGTRESEVGVSARYEVVYFYFRLEETGNSLLIQRPQGLPQDLVNGEERVWSGRMSSVSEVIFYETTQSGLRRAGLPQDDEIPVIETGDTPDYYRELLPVYLMVVGFWVLSLLYLVWRKNKPFLGL